MDFIGEIIKGSGAPLVERVSDGKNLKRNYEKLIEHAKHLYRKRDDIKEEVIRGGTQKKAKREVLGWLDKVGQFENQMNMLEGAYGTEKRWLWGWCPDVTQHMKLGKLVVEMLNQITNLEEKSKFEGGVVIDTISHTTPMPAPTIEAATSTDLTIQNIMEFMRDERIGKIGVWGMGGVGKTTIMKNLNNRKDIAKIFDIVIWVTLSKDRSIREVQKEVARRLFIQLEDDMSQDEATQEIFQKLKTMKFLLLLDDVWQNIDLNNIGIPDPKHEIGSKVVLTTRFLGVCHKMQTDKEIQVKVLLKEESWRLFHEKVGEVIYLPNIEPIARDVVSECGGLPLAIIVIGASLRKEENVHVWKNALNELRAPDTSKIEDMEEVFRRLEFSYDRLGDDNLKNCFLYAALYPENSMISVCELIERWRDEGYIDVVGNLVEAREKGHALLKVLKDACLFERGWSENYIKMHDVIRDLALKITSPKGESCKFLVRAGLGTKEAPKEEEWKQVQKMSLMMNNYESYNLPDRPECPMLTTLFLQENAGLRTIPEPFFNHMRALQVLDLSETGIKCLPSSICNLVSLVALYLYNCFNLEALPSQIGALKKLEVLNVDRAYYNRERLKINCLATEIGELTRLKSLKVTLLSKRNNNQHRNIISHGVLSRLSQLEELSICFSKDPLDLVWDQCIDVAEELGRLKQLISLQFVFPKVECLNQFINNSPAWKNHMLTTFAFTIGCYNDFNIEPFDYPEPGSRGLEFIKGNSIPPSVVEVLNHSKVFILAYHNAIRKLSEFGVKNMSGLQKCSIFACDAMETLIDGNGLVEEGVLPKLENLEMSFLPNLRSIWEGPVPPKSLNRLKKLTLCGCFHVFTILSRGMIQQLSSLVRLEVLSCWEVKEIVEEDSVVEHHLLPKLNELSLQDLWKLERICCKGVQLALPSVEIIQLEECPELTSFLEGMADLTNIKKLTLIRCPKVSKIFSRDIIQQLSKLEELTIWNCPEIKEMVEEEIVEYNLLPKLKILELQNVPKLLSIGSKGVPFAWPSLEEIRVIECQNLKKLPLGVDNTTTLKKIGGEREWWEALEWEDGAIKQQFQPLFIPWP